MAMHNPPHPGATLKEEPMPSIWNWRLCPARPCPPSSRLCGKPQPSPPTSQRRLIPWTRTISNGWRSPPHRPALQASHRHAYPQAKYDKASYRSLAKVIAAESGNDDIAEFIRRATFNVLIGNGDMHLKNWSLIYRDQRHATLSPAYDFVSTLAYIPGERSALPFSRSKAFADYTTDELEHLAAKAALPRKLVMDTAQETVALFMQHWGSEKNHLPMDKHVRNAIDRHHGRLPIVAA